MLTDEQRKRMTGYVEMDTELMLLRHRIGKGDESGEEKERYIFLLNKHVEDVEGELRAERAKYDMLKNGIGITCVLLGLLAVAALVVIEEIKLNQTFN